MSGRKAAGVVLIALAAVCMALTVGWILGWQVGLLLMSIFVTVTLLISGLALLEGE